MTESAAPDVYPVGLFRDVRNTWDRLHAPRKRGRRAAIRSFCYWFGRSWRRRSYWNGYLAEVDAGWRAGHGWTPGRARRDLAHHLTVEVPDGT